MRYSSWGGRRHSKQSRFLSGGIPRSAVIDEDTVKFQLFDVLKLEENLLKKERFHHISRDIISDSLMTAKKIAEEKFASHNKLNDSREPSLHPSQRRVDINAEVKDAINAYKDAGFFRYVKD